MINSLQNHKSIRSFEERKIEREVVEKLLETGIRAANAGNLQGYSLVVIDDEEIKSWYSEKEGFFQTRNSKERLEELSKIGIFNLAQAYARNKYKEDKIEEISEGVKSNIKKSGYNIL